MYHIRQLKQSVCQYMVHTLYIIVLLKDVNNNENTNLSLMQDQTNLFQLEKDEKMVCTYMAVYTFHLEHSQQEC